MSSSKKPVYRIRYQSEDKLYEIYARKVDTSAMFGFVEIGDFVWGRRSSVIVDPSEQVLRNEFDGVSRTYVPYNAIRRIDVVEKSGSGKILSLAGKRSIEGGEPPLLLDPDAGAKRGR